MVCPCVPEARNGQVTLLGWGAQLCSQFGTSALERRTVGGQRQSLPISLLSWVWWCEDGTRPVPVAPAWVADASAGPRMGRDTGSQQATLKCCTQ